jgi:hypothetical protein
MIIFALLLIIGNLLVMRFAAPALLRSAELAHIKSTLVQIVVLTYASTFVAALLAGAAAGLRGLRRGSVSRAGNLSSALFGTLLVVVAIISYALVARLPVPGRSTEINLGLVAIGALLGSFLADLRGRGRRGPATIPTPGPRPPAGAIVASLCMLVNLAGSGFDFERSDCVIQSRELSVDVDVTVLSFSLGPHFAYQEVQHADGKWEASGTTGVMGGLHMVLGEHIAANLFKGSKLQEGLSLELDADGLLTTVETYELDTKEATDNAVKWDALHYLDSVVALPGVAELIQLAIPPDTMSSTAKIPKETDIELAGSVKLSVHTAAGLGYAVDLALGSKGGLKVLGADPTRQPIDNPKEIDIYVGLNGEVDASVTALLATVNGHGAGDLVLTMAIGPPKVLPQVWLPSKVSLVAGGEVGGGGGFAFSNEGTAATAAKTGLATALKDFGSAASGALRLEVASELNFSLDDGHPADWQAFADFFGALEPVLRGQPTPAQLAALQTATQAFALALARDGAFRAALYASAAGNLSVAVAMGEIFSVGARGEADMATEDLKGAIFVDQTRQWVASRSCGTTG